MLLFDKITCITDTCEHFSTFITVLNPPAAAANLPADTFASFFTQKLKRSASGLQPTRARVTPTDWAPLAACSCINETSHADLQS